MSADRAAELRAALGLEVLEGESGWFAPLARDEAASSIWYLLDRERPVNFLHHLVPSDTHVLVEGGPVEYLLFPDGADAPERVVCGRDLAAGQCPAVVAPAGCAKALVLHPDASHALLVTVVAPPWTPGGVRIGAGAEFVARWAGTAPWATEARLREVIGPTWQEQRQTGAR